ncbi:hypothetical protein BS78_09G085100 [Paspalum vaginatum]|nr:hypothetical protein BS78_09G085100 [Paspalum vaginatum]
MHHPLRRANQPTPSGQEAAVTVKHVILPYRKVKTEVWKATISPVFFSRNSRLPIRLSHPPQSPVARIPRWRDESPCGTSRSLVLLVIVPRWIGVQHLRRQMNRGASPLA